MPGRILHENKRPSNDVCRLHTVSIDHGFAFPPHYHEEAELMGIEQDTGGTITVGGTAYPLARGSFFYIPENAIHYCDVKTPVRRVFVTVYLNANFFRTTIGRFEKCADDLMAGAFDRPVVVTGQNAAALTDALSRLAFVHRGINPGVPLEQPVAEALGDVGGLFRLLSLAFMKAGPMVDLNRTGPVRKAIDFVETSFERRITLEEIGRSCTMSRSNLCRAFKRHTGMGLWEYLAQVRIHHAKEMLRQGEANVSEVADACGFASPSYFTRVFNKTVGIKPKRWQMENAR